MTGSTRRGSVGHLAPTSRALPVLLAAAMTLAAASAAADPPPATTTSAAAPLATPPPRKVTQADRDAARTLAEQGFERFQQRKYREAIVLFSKAEERFHAPTHVAYIARRISVVTWSRPVSTAWSASESSSDT